MFRLSFILISALLLLSHVYSYHNRITLSNKITTSKNSLKLNSFFTTLTTAATEVIEKPDDYVYGAVAAPGWVLPVASVFVILSAALPFLLKPGEEALEQQRRDEETKGKTFGKKGDV